MNKKNKSILIGLALGDGCVSKNIYKRYNSVSYYIGFTHGIKQYEYLKFKANLLNKILGGKQNQVRVINNSGYAGCKYQKAHKDLKFIYELLYYNGKKRITRKALDYLDAEAIAYWYMDDGSLYAQKRNGKIHAYSLVISTYCDTEEEVNEIIKYFMDVWNIKFNIKRNKGKFSITCNTREIRKFLPIIKPYVSKIPCMSYKIKDV